MEQNKLNESLALGKRHLCATLGQLMDERTTIGTLWQYGGKVIASPMPCNLSDWLEMCDDETEALFVVLAFGRGPLYGRLDAFAFQQIDFRCFGENLIGLLHQHLIADQVVDQQKTLTTGNGNERYFRIGAPGHRSHHIVGLDGFDATTSRNFPYCECETSEKMIFLVDCA